MSLGSKPTDDLIRIAVVGGGLRFNAAAKNTDDLIRIAVVTKKKGAQLFFSGIGSRATDDLIRIAVAGGGNVVFED